MKPCRSAYVFSPAYYNYDFGPEHPMRPERGKALGDLLLMSGMLRGRRISHIRPQPAGDDCLLLAHTAAYIETVKALSTGVSDRERAEAAGLGEGDTPAFAGMHAVAATIAGGTLAAVHAVMRGETEHAFNPGGGLHHAHRDRASGFCVYNDLVAAIATVVREYGAKVLYIDLDVHHGDGVQAAFYDDPRVLTLSFHETGRYLFPGTGTVTEFGAGAGFGASLNVPLAAFTQDESWLDSIEALVPAVAERFHPDLIVSQFGCDGHAWDGQAHLRLTTAAYQQAATLVHEVAHALAAGRWVATGGGGYDPVRVVPRVWALVWAEMAGRKAPERLPDEWIAKWRDFVDQPMPETWIDPPDIVAPIPRRSQIEAENARTVARVREVALSPQLRLAYRPRGRLTSASRPEFPDGRIRRLTLARGEVLLRDRCPVSVVRRMRVAEGLDAFSRRADREHALLQRIAAQPENNLVIAHTPAGEIVGEVTMTPADGRWSGLEGVYEAGVQVAPDWRSTGLARAMLSFAFEPEVFERLIVLAQGLSWHWDLETAGVDVWAYREMIVRLFKSAGFEVYPTDDPEIAGGEANVLLARSGKAVRHDVYDEFYQRLHTDEDWRGF